jgi:hypothetical protein
MWRRLVPFLALPLLIETFHFEVFQEEAEDVRHIDPLALGLVSYLKGHSALCFIKPNHTRQKP